MKSKDDVLLEYLADVGSAEPLGVIYWNLEDRGLATFSYQTALRRLQRLVEAGLVHTPKTDTTYYQISDDGLAYLEGDHRPPDDVGSLSEE